MPRYDRGFGGNRHWMGAGMPGYGADYDPGGGYGEEFRYRGATRGGWSRGDYGHGGIMYGSRSPGGGYGTDYSPRGGGAGRRGGYRGRGHSYDTYFRRDFMTNQGTFEPEHGYGSMGEPGGRGGMSRAYRPEGDWGAGDLGGRMRGAGRRSYGPGYGERWESTHPEDIARRNYYRR